MKVPFNDLTRIHAPILDLFQRELSDIVLSNEFVLGEKVSSFESNYAKWEGSQYCVSVNNGTVALELALISLGIGPGDEVIVPAFTFVATVFAVLRTGATPVLCDIKKGVPLIDSSSLESLISKKTKAIIAVTLHGRVDDLQLIRRISRDHKLKFIIDAAQSHGARFNGNPLVKFADICTYSFYPGKNLGALGEGGAILTNQRKIFDKLSLMKNWGAKTKYNQTTWGGNFRLETLQAAFLNLKLEQMDKWTHERKQIAKQYSAHIALMHQTEPVSTHGDHVYHIYEIRVRNRNLVIEKLKNHGIQTGIHYPRAVHQNKFYAKLAKGRKFPNSEKIAAETLSLPIFPGITSQEIEYVSDNINRVLS